MRFTRVPSLAVAAFLSILSGDLATSLAADAEPFIPRRQSQPPGPPLSPTEALAKMTVPEGFRVELVAAEPDLVNPVAMAFDDRGRLFVTESFEYPRREPGPGRDRVKILEDTTGDGRFDSVKIFADGLNIPSGIAVGHGGVWVANAPDILFLEDTNGDDRADRQTVVVSGFGRDDTHELPNALTWGPDGYLYGLNGVFNRSVVRQGDQTFDFTCAMFRIDPATHRFELFCEGTSNPWGIAFDPEGEAFISACVIDHLWHLTETGYYHRQGGPYPPHTWKIDSIVSHKHQMAAYCGLEYFDSPAYPAEYRNKLYMGNIHGGCINADSVTRHGSTYRGQGHPDLLTANDVWFMPVAQKLGPDGCLYILDWYDRYHCYQDANADPEGVDRGHGRLYRLVYEQRPEIEHPDLGVLADNELIDLLQHANLFYRQRAAVILAERLRTDRGDASRQTFAALLGRLTEDDSSRSLQLLTTTLSAPQMTLQELARLKDRFAADPLVTSWCVRTAGERIRQLATRESLSKSDRQSIQRWTENDLQSAASHPDPRVRVQAAIAAGKLPADSPAEVTPTRLLLDVLRGAEDDGSLPRIVWRNLEPHVVDDQSLIVAELARSTSTATLLDAMAPRIATRLLAEVRPDLSGDHDVQTLASVLAIADVVAVGPDPSDDVLRAVLAKLRTGEIRAAAARPVLLKWLHQARIAGPARWQLEAFADDETAQRKVAALLLDPQLPTDRRREALETVAVTTPAALAAAVNQWISDLDANRPVDDGWRDALMSAVVSHGDADTQRGLLGQWSRLPVGARAMVAGRMIQRDSTASLLLDEIVRGNLAKDMLGPDQIRQLAASRSEAVRGQVKSIWGTVRLQDSANRRQVVSEMTDFLLTDAHGDAARGWAVYDRICGQCHVMHNRGYEVGPDITRNGRSQFEQLVVSVFDPSLVIGDAYKSVSVLTVDGRAISGLVVERSDRRIVLKVQGGKQEIVPIDEIEAIQDNQQSLMPEGLEEQMTPQEMADLFALLSLENPPSADDNRVIAGTPQGLHGEP